MVALGFETGGGAGGGGAVTVRVAREVTLTPGPVAVSVYVVELAGDTLRLPALITVPTPLSIEMLVAWPATSQRSVADCPRWMVVGSNTNCATVGAAGAGAGLGVSTVAGGGGGG